MPTEFWYYVTNPSLGFSAGVQAPTSEKARTAYLDYLERTGRIRRGDRQTLRRQILTKRVDILDESQVDIKIPYEYIEEMPEVLALGSEVIGDTGQIPQAGGEQEMSPLQKLVLTGKVD